MFDEVQNTPLKQSWNRFLRDQNRRDKTHFEMTKMPLLLLFKLSSARIKHTGRKEPGKEWASTFCFTFTWDTLHDLLLFVQLKKREKDPWGTITFSKLADLVTNVCISGGNC